MRILVLDANYPHDKNLYGDVFVHVRVARYLRLGHDVRVISFFNQMEGYTFDGVRVECAPDLTSLERLIAEFRPDVVALHFFQGWMLRKLISRSTYPFVIWVHGMEALGWYRRLFNLAISREFAEYVAYNTIQMWRFRKLVAFAREHRGRVEFIFVSDWMRRIAEADTLSRIPSYSVIPNPIDTERFPYVEKPAEQRHRVLLIRSFDSMKYANDIAVEAIQLLSQKPQFQNFSFSIHGRGRMFDEITRPLRNFNNVSIHEGFLTQPEIRALHQAHGLMLCPTRQDAQGVSMCEAMSSGLIPLTSKSSAIPEFVQHNETGFLTRNSSELADAMLQLHSDEALFARMSRAAASSIRQRSGIEAVVNSEMDVMTRAAEQSRAE
jgi:glycosyltransferase involved in cell wall biosynthesis